MTKKNPGPQRCGVLSPKNHKGKQEKITADFETSVLFHEFHAVSKGVVLCQSNEAIVLWDVFSEWQEAWEKNMYNKFS